MIKYLLIFISAISMTGCASHQVSHKNCVMMFDRGGNEYIRHYKGCKAAWWEHFVTDEQADFWRLNGEDINKRKYFK